MNHLYLFVDISWFAFVVVDYFVYVVTIWVNTIVHT